jgi:hypothetical protein
MRPLSAAEFSRSAQHRSQSVRAVRKWFFNACELIEFQIATLNLPQPLEPRTFVPTCAMHGVSGSGRSAFAKHLPCAEQLSGDQVRIVDVDVRTQVISIAGETRCGGGTEFDKCPGWPPSPHLSAEQFRC